MDVWIEDIKAERGDDVIVVLVGNKVDLQVRRLSLTSWEARLVFFSS